MVRAATILIILFLIFVVVPHGFSGGISVGAGHVGKPYKLTPHYRFNHRSSAHRYARNYQSIFRTVKKHSKHPARFIYDPRLVFFRGSQQPENTEKLEVTLKIITSEKDEPFKHPVKKERPISPPHMKTVHSFASDETDLESVILIRGTQVRETP